MLPDSLSKATAHVTIGDARFGNHDTAV